MHGNPYGTSKGYPILDTWKQELEFYDWHLEWSNVNTSSPNVISEFDKGCKRHLSLKEIFDHHSNDAAVTEEEAVVTRAIGIRKQVGTTRDGNPCVKERMAPQLAQH